MDRSAVMKKLLRELKQYASRGVADELKAAHAPTVEADEIVEEPLAAGDHPEGCTCGADHGDSSEAPEDFDPSELAALLGS